MVAGRLGADPDGDDEQGQAGHHGRAVDEGKDGVRARCGRENHVEAEAGNDAECDPARQRIVSSCNSPPRLYITHQSCHARIAEPRQKPTAVSDARIGVLTALIPIPTLVSEWASQAVLDTTRLTQPIDDANAHQVNPRLRKHSPNRAAEYQCRRNGDSASPAVPIVDGQGQGTADEGGDKPRRGIGRPEAPIVRFAPLVCLRRCESPLIVI